MNIFEMINADKIVADTKNQSNKQKYYDDLVESIYKRVAEEEILLKKQFILGFPEYAKKNGLPEHKYKSTEVFGGKFTGWLLQGNMYISNTGEIYKRKVKFDPDGYSDRIYYKKASLAEFEIQDKKINGYINGHIVNISGETIDLDWSQSQITDKIKHIAVERVRIYAEDIIKDILDGKN